MEYRTLGSTGLDVSELCFGTWRFGKESDGTVETTREEAHDLLDAAWERGVNFVDTANVYGTPNGTSERWIGEWLADRDREDLVIASKVRGPVGDGPNASGLGRKHVRAQVDASLDRLGTDYLDLYYVHWWDPDTPIRETLRTLDRLVAEGRVRYLGASNLAAHQLAASLRASDVGGLERFDVCQPHFNAAHRDPVDGVLDVCADRGLAVCPWSPLEGGFLTGKYDRDAGVPEGSRANVTDWGDEFADRQWATLDAVRTVADEVDATPAQVSLQWLIQQDAFTCVPIVGARTIDQLDENVGAVDLDLSADQVARIDDAYRDAE